MLLESLLRSVGRWGRERETSKKRKQASVALCIGPRESSPGLMESGAMKRRKPSEKGKSPLDPSLPIKKGEASCVDPYRPRVVGVSFRESAGPGETSEASLDLRAASQVSLGPSRMGVAGMSFHELARPGETSGRFIGPSSTRVAGMSFQGSARPGETSGQSIGTSHPGEVSRGQSIRMSRRGEVSVGVSGPRVEGVSFREPGCRGETREGGQGQRLIPDRPRRPPHPQHLNDSSSGDAQHGE